MENMDQEVVVLLRYLIRYIFNCHGFCSDGPSKRKKRRLCAIIRTCIGGIIAKIKYVASTYYSQAM
jgi:hypothetical protein